MALVVLAHQVRYHLQNSLRFSSAGLIVVQNVAELTGEAAAKMKIPNALDIFLEMFRGDLPDDGDRRFSSVICSLGIG